ncbi:MAG TPA: RHS repeat-associated core domain-containing protein [Humisphaera sp.]
MAGFTSAYDRSGNKLFERHLHAECRSFLYPHRPGDPSAYDSLDRLLEFRRGRLRPGGSSVQTPLALPGVDYYRAYNLDRTGNWVDTDEAPAVIWERDCGEIEWEERSTNSLNQAIDGSRYTYDANGNLKTDGRLSYTYDLFNRLTRVQGKGPSGAAVDVEYVYDPLNRRVAKRQPGSYTVTMRFVYDGTQVVEERGGSGAVLRQYVWGQYVDELVQQREYEHAPPGRDYVDWYPLSDLLYRTVALTDDRICEGATVDPFHPSLVEVYDTDVYGRTKAYRKPGPGGFWFDDDDEATFAPRCRYLFTGREYDPETGLYYYRARYYHPDLGRFLNRDPLLYDAGDLNVYAYCYGKPSILTDPDGEIPPLVAALLIAAVVGAIVGALSNVARQSIQKAEGSKRDFDWGEFAESTAFGAISAPVFVLVPELAIPLAAIGVSSGIHEIGKGNVATGAFDITTSLLPFTSKRGRSMTFGSRSLFSPMVGGRTSFARIVRLRVGALRDIGPVRVGFERDSAYPLWRNMFGHWGIWAKGRLWQATHDVAVRGRRTRLHSSVEFFREVKFTNIHHNLNLPVLSTRRVINSKFTGLYNCFEGAARAYVRGWTGGHPALWNKRGVNPFAGEEHAGGDKAEGEHET